VTAADACRKARADPSSRPGSRHFSRLRNTPDATVAAEVSGCDRQPGKRFLDGLVAELQVPKLAGLVVVVGG
jgi:hypothetical protein